METVKVQGTVDLEPSRPSIKISRTTRGYTWEVKAYADTLEEAIQETLAADEQLRQHFGLPKEVIV